MFYLSPPPTFLPKSPPPPDFVLALANRTRDHGWPITDCTSEGLKATLILHERKRCFVCAAFVISGATSCVNLRRFLGFHRVLISTCCLQHSRANSPLPRLFCHIQTMCRKSSRRSTTSAFSTVQFPFAIAISLRLADFASFVRSGQRVAELPKFGRRVRNV